MRFTRKFIYILVLNTIIFSSILLFPPKCLPQDITSQTALQGALYYAQGVFGTLLCLDNQMLVDMDNNPQVYIFILCHPEDLVSDLETIRNNINHGQLSESERSGFVTVVAGANKSHVPVIQMYQGLPDYVLNQNGIKDMLRDMTSLEGWEVVRYLYPAPLECWLEFKSQILDETFLVRASDMKIMSAYQAMKFWDDGIRARDMDFDIERTERIRKKWEAVEGMQRRLEKGSSQEDIWEPDDTPQEAKSISPNGPSQYHTFTQQADKDWVVFFAEENISYQIFTRPKDPGYSIDTKIYLYDQEVLFNPSPLYIVYNDDFVDNYCSFIDWVCPNDGFYYILIKSYNPDTYGSKEAYSIQVTSFDLQDEATIIREIPDYSQSDFGDPGNCAPVAAACILGYWDAHGYDLLVDSAPTPMEGMAGLVYELQNAMHYPSIDHQNGGVRDEDVPIGIERVCNSSAYNNDYDFRTKLIYNPDSDVMINEIIYNRPVLYGVMGHSTWQDHWMTTVGYLETDTTLWIINHDNWSNTPRELYVDWDEATDCIVTIFPDKPSDNIYSDPNPQYPMPFFNPGMGIWPYPGFGISPFAMINNRFGSIGSPWSEGYSGYANWGDSFGLERFMGGTGFFNQNSVLAGIQQPLFSIGNNNFNGTNNYPTRDFLSLYSPQYSFGGKFFPNPAMGPINPFFSNSRLFPSMPGLSPFPKFTPLYSFPMGFR